MTKVIKGVVSHINKVFFIFLIAWVVLGGVLTLAWRRKKANVSEAGRFIIPLPPKGEDERLLQYKESMEKLIKPNDLASYSSLLERDIFSQPKKAPTLVVTDEEPEGIEVNLEIVSIEPIPFSLKYTGYILLPDETSIAFLRLMNEKGAPSVRARLGDEVSGFKIIEILPERVKIKKGSKVTQLHIGKKAPNDMYKATLYDIKDESLIKVQKGALIGGKKILDITLTSVTILIGKEKIILKRETGYE